MSRYDVNVANTNRNAKFQIDAGAAGAFGILKGTNAAYPHYGQLKIAATADQNLAQLRTSAMVRAVSVYTIATGVEIDATGQFLTVTFEVDEQGEFFNNASTDGVTTPKHLVGTIADTLGTGGMTTIKTKPGLQALATAALASTYGTNGTTTLFAGNVGATATVLANGTTPTLAAVAAVTVTYVA